MNTTDYIYNKVSTAALPLSLFLFAFLFGACDHIAEDEQLITVENALPPTPEDDPEDMPTATARYVLLEDFTGQKCVNCPKGTEVIEQLAEAYGERVIAVGIHGGDLGFKGNATMKGLATDLGDEYYDYWKLEYQPVGLIDRGEPTNYTDWTTAVYNELGFVSEIKMELEVRLQENAIDIKVSETALGGAYSGKVQVWVLEDGIVAQQKMPDGSLNKEYIHNHVLRTAVNGTWGEDVAIGRQETKTQTYTQAVDADWNTANLSIVAFVYNGDGVEQAVKAKVVNEE